MTDEEKLKLFDLLFAEAEQLVDVQTLERFKTARIEQLEDAIDEAKDSILGWQEEIKNLEAEIERYDDIAFLRAEYVKDNIQTLKNTIW